MIEIPFVSENMLIIAVAVAATVVALAAPLVILTAMRHKARVELDHYGKFRGAAAARSFVCPDCLTRSYAPTHIRDRWCVKCEKTAPERVRVKVDQTPPWFTDDLKPRR